VLAVVGSRVGVHDVVFQDPIYKNRELDYGGGFADAEKPSAVWVRPRFTVSVGGMAAARFADSWVAAQEAT
jgi:hypothetical protein